MNQDRRSVAVACIAQHYRITASLDQRGRVFDLKTENVMARLVLVHFCHGSIKMDSGMKRKKNGSAVVLSLRALSYTPERWDQFWWKVDR